MLAQPPIPLPPMTWRCLALMALTAHDDTGLYWAGTDYLRQNLGYQAGAYGRREIQRHLARICAAGYASRTDKRKGHRTVYELHLPGP